MLYCFSLCAAAAQYLSPTGIAVSYNGGIFIDKPKYKPETAAEHNAPLVYAYFDCSDIFFRLLKENYGINPSGFDYGKHSSIQIAGTPELEYIYYYLGKILAFPANEGHVDLLVKDLSLY